jgi:hypothetical protein
MSGLMDNPARPAVATACVACVGFARASLFDASGEGVLTSGTSALSLFDERPAPAGA